jgi:hypothetical protein
MRTEIERDSPTAQLGQASLARGVVAGLIGGFVGTIVMDVILIGTLSAIGLPPVISFNTIGDTAAGCLAVIGIKVAGGFPLGAAAHYLLGLGLGAIFGAAMTRLKARRVSTLKRGIAFAVLYIEIVSQPILALSPLVLTMTTSATVQWFGISAVMHLIWGVVLGAVVSYGLRSVPATPMTLTPNH